MRAGSEGVTVGRLWCVGWLGVLCMRDVCVTVCVCARCSDPKKHVAGFCIERRTPPEKHSKILGYYILQSRRRFLRYVAGSLGADFKGTLSSSLKA